MYYVNKMTDSEYGRRITKFRELIISWIAWSTRLGEDFLFLFFSNMAPIFFYLRECAPAAIDLTMGVSKSPNVSYIIITHITLDMLDVTPFFPFIFDGRIIKWNKIQHTHFLLVSLQMCVVYNRRVPSRSRKGQL